MEGAGAASRKPALLSALSAMQLSVRVRPLAYRWMEHTAATGICTGGGRPKTDIGNLLWGDCQASIGVITVPSHRVCRFGTPGLDWTFHFRAYTDMV